MTISLFQHIDRNREPGFSPDHCSTMNAPQAMFRIWSCCSSCKITAIVGRLSAMQLHKRTTSTISEKGNKSHEKHGGRTQWRRKKKIRREKGLYHTASRMPVTALLPLLLLLLRLLWMQQCLFPLQRAKKSGCCSHILSYNSLYPDGEKERCCM